MRSQTLDEPGNVNPDIAGSESRLMKFECFIQISPLRRPGFSRISLSRQYAAAPAGIPLAKAGTPESRWCRLFGGGTRFCASAPAGIPPAKAGTPESRWCRFFGGGTRFCTAAPAGIPPAQAGTPESRWCRLFGGGTRFCAAAARPGAGQGFGSEGALERSGTCARTRRIAQLPFTLQEIAFGQLMKPRKGL
jgi:hypothetical protein